MAKVVALAALLAVAGQAASPVARAEAFFDLLVKQDFAAATAMCTENMAKALPEEKLRQSWATLGAQAGAFRSRESGRAEARQGGHDVWIRAVFERAAFDIRIFVNNDGKIGGLSQRVIPPPSAPPPYADPSKFTERDVTVGSGEWALPGTLTLPNGQGPFPALVLVHGSGPSDRDETLGPNRPFRDLAHGLASRGIAVLRYDKRTRVHGARMAQLRTTVQQETVDDAALAVSLLTETPGVAADRVFVLGHSLGGMLVPRIAAASPEARGFVVLAGAARPLEQAMLEQIDYIARLDDRVTPEEQARIDDMKSLAERVRALTRRDAESNERIGGAPASYWLDLRNYDPPAAARNIARPMLVLQGERDYQVTMAEFARWSDALAGRPNVTLKSYPALNHRFMAGEGRSVPMEYLLPRHVAEDVIADIAAFVARPKPFAETAISIVPYPARVERGRGAFALTRTTPIVADAAARKQARQLAMMLAPATGFDLPVRVGAAPRGAHIALRIDPALQKTLGTEGYRLSVTPAAVTIRAGASAGLFYGMQTLRQLLPPEIFREAEVERRWTVPAVTIEDHPGFSWRGMHLDVARHFQPKEFVKKYIDLLALHKMNRFHWHLTDDQGWRIEIRRYPKLTSVAAWRKQTLIGPYRTNPLPEHFDGKPHGGFYTQDDIREIVAYAADRFITIVPEIEMPGHSQAIIAAYPELGSVDEPVEVRPTWAVSPYILNADASTVSFMQNVLAEVLELFPGPWIHIGGDEADKTQWKNNPRIQARMRELDVKDEHELQSWFIRQMDAFLTARHRRLIGWDEILEGGLAANATVMAWRGIEHAMTAARSGHDAVLAPTSHTYFDYYQAQDRAREPLAIGGFLPLERVYAWEPMPAGLEPRFQKHVLGVQGQVWTEYLPNPKAVEYMAFPRASALSEVAWSPAAARRFDDFRARLVTHLARLRILDVNFRSPE